ncbi:hypothetical protein HHK36_001878 [Tetracentron sinense]|uniref:tRNA-uridine aminocarboxypropyltransferase n=1 Tax=Tetracentron sinense TaxID=13715 RepID=A0A835DV37_TETSI|nr:hypothetical protein HHK36_001878 [Tetracentron sinense]
MLSSACAFSLKWSQTPSSRNRTKTDSRPRNACDSSWRSNSHSHSDATISLQEWQSCGTSSQIPAMVIEVVEGLKVLEREMDSQMSFGGIGGKLQIGIGRAWGLWGLIVGNFKVQEDRKHRATYQALVDSEKKLQFFAARQIACRLLGNRGYLCQKCWLPLEDCMCSKIMPCSLWGGIRFWLYMHPQDFLRQNNTGKLLWQLFGVEAATLCLFGIAEHEEIMRNAFKLAVRKGLILIESYFLSGKSTVWCLYPFQNASTKSVKDILFHGSSGGLEGQSTMSNGTKPMHFVLIDGTWNNSAAMFRRLKEQAKLVWGEDDLPCISLTTGVSAMHKLRPQPSWDRTCTAAASIGLLSELYFLPEFSSYGLDKQAEAVEEALGFLLDALTARRLRMGRSIARRGRQNINIC